MPKGYLVANYKSIHDPNGMAEYSKAAPPVLAEHGGNVILAETEPVVLEGEWNSAMLVVIEFESVDAARAWYDSSGYRAARAFRQASADCDIMIVPGFEMPQAGA
jgi:uncharacterized protein (DUF1330 family)